jgi:GntR family transcriptional regulator
MSQNVLSNRPLYLQVRDALAERIAKAVWKPGSSIPNEGDLAREFGVSPGTMRKALDLIEAERLVTRRQGRGTFVNDQASEGLATRFSSIRGTDGRRIVAQIKAGEITQGTANELECERLRLQATDHVYRVRRIQSHAGQPFMVEEVSLPAMLFPGLGAKDGVSHRIADLAQQHGILLGKARERISIGLASPEAAEDLGIASAAAIMVLDRVTQALDGCPVEWRVGECHLHDHHYLAEMT